MSEKTPKTNKNIYEGTSIGAGVKLIGSLKDEGPVTINGIVEGDIFSSQTIIVGQNAQISGPISAQQVTVAGIVEGEIRAEDTLEITPTGQVGGKIETRTLSIKPGALFTGQCKMIEHAKDEPIPDFEPEKD